MASSSSRASASANTSDEDLLRNDPDLADMFESEDEEEEDEDDLDDKDVYDPRGKNHRKEQAFKRSQSLRVSSSSASSSSSSSSFARQGSGRSSGFKRGASAFR